MEIRTDRLFIRNLCGSDWAEMKDIFIDFNKSEYVVYDRPLPTDDEGAKALTKQFAHNPYLIDKFKNKFICVKKLLACQPSASKAR